jgi:hypothetical protein
MQAEQFHIAPGSQTGLGRYPRSTERISSSFVRRHIRGKRTYTSVVCLSVCIILWTCASTVNISNTLVIYEANNGLNNVLGSRPEIPTR